jgi:hypothetical protein
MTPPVILDPQAETDIQPVYDEFERTKPGVVVRCRGRRWRLGRRCGARLWLDGRAAIDVVQPLAVP